MTEYEWQAREELFLWQKSLAEPPSMPEKWASQLQKKWNGIIPEKIHQFLDQTFRHFISAVLSGSQFIQKSPETGRDLAWIEAKVRDKITVYANTAAAEGALTGAGGFISALADLPLWLSIKMRMLAEIARLYGHDLASYRERVVLLDIFQLSFSRPEHRDFVYARMISRAHHPDLESEPETIWRDLQQEYRDYIDLAKLLQLIPGIGAVVGALVNQKLTKKLGNYSMQAYRMRWFADAARPPKRLQS